VRDLVGATGVGSGTHDDRGRDDHDDEPSESQLQSWRWIELRRMVAYEALALVAVLGFTAVLVNTTPARTATLFDTPVVNLTDDTSVGEVNLVVTPARVGSNTMHVQYYDDTGRPVDVANTITIEMSLPDEDIGPITRQVAKVSPGHFIYEGDDLSVAGDWTVVLAARTSDFAEERTSFAVRVSR
jgi:copper transport protein